MERKNLRMKVLSLAVVLFLFLTGGLWAAGQKEVEPGAGEGVMEKAEYVMRIGHAHPVEHLRHQALLRFKDSVEAETNGRVEVEIYPGGQLGKEREMMESAKLGTIEAVRSGAYESYNRELLALTLPFLFDSLEQAREILLGPVGDYLAGIGDRLTIIAWQHSAGFRHIANNVRPIEKPADLDGLKIRVPPIETSKLTVDAFGANATPVAWAETYLACKTGVVDGVENANVHLFSGKIYEVAKYLSLTGHIYHPGPLFVNKKWWDDLPSDLQSIISEAAEESCAWHDEQVLSDDREKLNKMSEYGIKVNRIPEKNIPLFQERSKEVYQYYADKGVFSEEMRARLSEALGRALL